MFYLFSRNLKKLPNIAQAIGHRSSTSFPDRLCRHSSLTTNMVEPTLEIHLLISPPIFSLSQIANKEVLPPTLTTTATLHHDKPVTLYTWPSIFNLKLAQVRHNFFCYDISSSNYQDAKPIDLAVYNAGKQAGTISRRIGSKDDKFWVTLYPNQQVTFAEKFALATRDGSLIRWDVVLKAGHRYRYGIKRMFLKDSVKWLDGVTREDVMTEKTGREKEIWREGFEKRELIVPRDGGDVVEFEVVE